MNIGKIIYLCEAMWQMKQIDRAVCVKNSNLFESGRSITAPAAVLQNRENIQTIKREIKKINYLSSKSINIRFGDSSKGPLMST